MAQAAQVRKSDDVVFGLWQGSTLPSPPVEADHYYFTLTPTEHETLSANPLFYGNDPTRPRWKIVSNALEEQPDTRRLVVFTPSAVVTAYQNNSTISVAVEVRQAPPNEDQIDTGINNTFAVLVNGRGPGFTDMWCDVTITAGQGTILIDREIIKEARISDQGVFRVDTPLQVRVKAPGRF